MSKFRVDLDKVEVIDGQGIGEGDFELQVTVMEGSHNVIWPSPSSWVQVDKNGAPKSINRTLATYEVTTGTLSKRVTVNVKEVDGRNDNDGRLHHFQSDTQHGNIHERCNPKPRPRQDEAPGQSQSDHDSATGVKVLLLKRRGNESSAGLAAGDDLMIHEETLQRRWMSTSPLHIQRSRASSPNRTP